MTIAARELADVSLAVEQAWADAKDTDEAAQNLYAMMLKDDDLYRAVLRPYEQNCAKMTVNQRKLTHRQLIWNKTPFPMPDAVPETHPAKDWKAITEARQRAARVTQRKALLSIAEKTLLDMPLASGIKLGEATYKDVYHSYEWAERHYKGNLAKAQFYNAVLTRLNHEETKVHEVWTLQELEEIGNKAKGIVDDKKIELIDLLS